LRKGISKAFKTCLVCFKDGASYCYEGQCRRIGCDGAMDGMELDNCGVCGGDSSSCIRKRFVWLAGSRGREQSLDIPASATNIKISQVRKFIFRKKFIFGNQKFSIFDRR